MLGMSVVANADGPALVVDPCIPKRWPGFTMTYRHGATTYRIAVENPRGANRGVDRVTLDGAELPTIAVPLADDGGNHEVVVTMIGG
jgi:cyclic beta-1,2-glucan synthetase